MAIGPQGNEPPLTEQEIRVVAQMESELDDVIRSGQPASKIVFLAKPTKALRKAQIQLLERRYVDAGWSKVSVAPTAGGAYVVTLLP